MISLYFNCHRLLSKYFHSDSNHDSLADLWHSSNEDWPPAYYRVGVNAVNRCGVWCNLLTYGGGICKRSIIIWSIRLTVHKRRVFFNRVQPYWGKIIKKCKCTFWSSFMSEGGSKHG